MQNKINFDILYVSYYKPNIFNLKLRHNLSLKNFFFLFLFLEFFTKNKFHFCFFFKKKTSSNSAIIRSPQRNKKAQIKINKTFYFLNLNFNLILNFNSERSIFFFIKKYFFFFESSLIFLKNYKIKIKTNKKII